MKFLLVCALAIQAHAELAFPGAQGFGARSLGGKGGRVIEVTRLDDNVKHPEPGMFRWAVAQAGPRIIKFRVAGDVKLLDTVKVKEPFITIDGSDAPALGICLRGGTLECRNTHDVIVRYVHIRLGDENTLRRNRELGLKRPKGSNGLDCVTLDHSRNIIFDHCSLSWSCDEIFGIVGCRNVTVQWCLMAEPLGLPALHPYGDEHGYVINASANTLSVHHCLMAHYVMRGPQFEANDMRRDDDYTVRMEAVNNIMFDYRRSGSRYTTGVEDHQDQAQGKQFQFQFLNNLYISRKDGLPEIQAVTKHDFWPGIAVAASGNMPLLNETTFGIEARSHEDSSNPAVIQRLRRELRGEPLFVTTATQSRQTAERASEEVLAHAGCDKMRDEVDQRIIKEVRERRFRETLVSQKDRGGWPRLDR